MDYPEITYTWSPWLNQIQSPWENVLHLGVKRQFKKKSVVLGNAQRVNDLYYLNTTNNGVLEISQKELGDLLGIHRVTLNHILSDLKDKGIIESQKCKKRINVSNMEKLLDQIKLEEQEIE